MEMVKNSLSEETRTEFIETLKARFDNNLHRHAATTWEEVEVRLLADDNKMLSLHAMEETGGEPDIIKMEGDTLIFMDCSKESPKGRRSLCYDQAAMESRKKHKPEGSAKGAAEEMGIEMLTGEDYKHLQTLDALDEKTSSWIDTPEDIRTRGGALFCDHRYGTIFIYHNGAESYYASRGFRGKLRF